MMAFQFAAFLRRCCKARSRSVASASCQVLASSAWTENPAYVVFELWNMEPKPSEPKLPVGSCAALGPEPKTGCGMDGNGNEIW